MLGAGESKVVDSKAVIATFNSKCDPLEGEHVVLAPQGKVWTTDDIAALLDAYYPCGEESGNPADSAKCIEMRPLGLHRGTVPNQLCWKSMGEVANRKLADAIDATCTNGPLSSEVNEAKCEAFEEVVSQFAAPPKFFSKHGLQFYAWEVGKYLLVGIPGAILAGWGFHVGYKMVKEHGSGPRGPLGGSPSGGKTPEVSPKSQTLGPKIDSSSSEFSSQKKADNAKSKPQEDGHSWYVYVGAGFVFLGAGAGLVLLAADDLTGVGVADDPLMVPTGGAFAWACVVLF